MKKLLTVALVFVFALALVFALGCNKKEEAAPATEGGATSGMGQSTPATGDSMATTTTTTTTTTTSPDSAKGGK